MRFALPLWMLFALAVAAVPGWAQDEKLIEGTRVVGNDYIPQEGILDEVKDILKPGEAFTPQREQAAKTALLAMGYFDDVQVTTEATDKGVTVILTVVEKQRIQRILFVGNTVVDDAALSEVIFTRVGHVIDDRIIRRDVRRIEDFYAQRGYIAHVSKASVGQFGVLTFVIEEARIESIVIEGLKRTNEEVVRRELTIQPGALFEESKVARDIQKLFNLGIFKNVSSDIRPGVKDPQRGIIVVIVIEEKRTGQASVAGGYSSLDGFVVVLSASENNFRGRGERASVSLELFGRTSYEVSFFEPYVDRKGSSASIRVYDTERRRRFVGGTSLGATDDSFDERRSGVTLSYSMPTGANTRTALKFRSEKVSSSEYQGTRTIVFQDNGSLQTQDSTTDIPGVSEEPGQRPPDNPDLDPDLPEPGDTIGPVIVAAPLHPGGRLVSTALSWTRDTRDLLANPTRGTYTTYSLEQAGSIFGGQTQFTKLQAEYRLFHRLPNKRDVIAGRLMAGISAGSLPLFESYSVGGAYTLRGYEDDRYRGERMALANLEYRRPFSDKLMVVGFVDAGSAFGGSFPTVVPGFSISAEDTSFDLHVGAGVGLRVVTPIGPIRLDFGWGEDGNQAHFSFGQMF